MTRLIEESEAKELLKAWLVGASITSFRFGTAFSLELARPVDAHYKKSKLPEFSEMVFLEEWWLGERSEWGKKVISRGAGVEPDEPVKAFELAKLIWSEGNIVCDVSASENSISIKFENSEVIHILCNGEDEFAFSLTEKNESEHLGKRSLVLSNCEYFANLC